MKCIDVEYECDNCEHKECFDCPIAKLKESFDDIYNDETGEIDL